MSEPLWAPWRMEYILAKKEGGCVFCTYATAAGPAMAEANVLVATDLAYVVLNRYPFAAGHLLVIPHRHESHLERLTLEEYDAVMRLVRETAIRLQRAVSCPAMNIGINLGQAAGAGIAEHLHVHLVPRWDGDTNFMPVIADVRVMPQQLAATFSHLEPYFRDIPGRRAH